MIKENLVIYDSEGKESAKIDLPDRLKPKKKYRHLIAKVIKGYLSNLRAGTASTKTRAEVSGGGHKPWKQKHTGRARSGSNRSPLWRKGGVIFGPKPHSWYTNIPRQEKQLALLATFSDRINSGDVRIVTDIKVGEPRTVAAEKLLQTHFSERGSVLIVVDKMTEELRRAFRNLAGCRNPVKLTTDDTLTAHDILWPDNILISQDAFKSLLEKRLGAN